MKKTQRKIKGQIFIDKDNNVFAIYPNVKKIEWFGIIRDQIDKHTFICYNSAENTYFRFQLKKPSVGILNLAQLIDMYPDNEIPKDWTMQ